MSTTIQASPFATLRGDWPARETVPSLIPAVAEDLYVGDCWIEQVVLVNIGGASQTVTIKDKQATPREVLSAVIVNPGDPPLILGLAGRFMPGGINWVAGDGVSIVGYVRWRYQP